MKASVTPINKTELPSAYQLEYILAQVRKDILERLYYQCGYLKSTYTASKLTICGESRYYAAAMVAKHITENEGQYRITKNGRDLLELSDEWYLVLSPEYINRLLELSLKQLCAEVGDTIYDPILGNRPKLSTDYNFLNTEAKVALSSVFRKKGIWSSTVIHIDKVCMRKPTILSDVLRGYSDRIMYDLVRKEWSYTAGQDCLSEKQFMIDVIKQIPV